MKVPNTNEQWEAVNFVRLLKKIVRESVDEVLAEYHLPKKPIQDLPPVSFGGETQIDSRPTHVQMMEKTQGPKKVVEPKGSGPKGRMTVKEAAKYMGVSVTYIYTRCRNGEIPHLKLGRKYYVYKEDIDKHLEVNVHDITP